MAAKYLVLVVAIAATAYASPLGASDVTDFDKVSAMIANAQNDDFQKAAAAAEIPAWETPAWMRRSNVTTLSVQSTVAFTSDALKTASTSNAASVSNSWEYIFFANAYLSALGFTSLPKTNTQTVVAAYSTVSAYKVTVTITNRRAGGASAVYEMTTTKFANKAAFDSSATTAAFQSSASTAAQPANLPSGAPTITVNVASVQSTSSVVTPTPTPSPSPTASVGRTTYGFAFGIAALVATLLAQLF